MSKAPVTFENSLLIARLDRVIYSLDASYRVGFWTSSPHMEEALQAVYDFLRFPIKEHKTGDSLEVGS